MASLAAMSGNALTCALVAAAMVRLAQACAVPHGGCRLEVCSKYASVSVATVDFPGASYDDPATWSKGSLPLIGYYLGKYNKLVNGGSYNRAGIKDTPSLNYERFDLETEVVDPRTGQAYAHASPSGETDLVSCCKTCAATDGCYLFQFFPAGSPAAFSKGVQCYLLSGGTSTWDWPERGTPVAGSARKQSTGVRATIPPSFVGGRCNGSTGVYDDPHFTGAHGTRFDFNGELDKSFCLVADQRVHINALLRGYRDEEHKDGATRGADGKALRTWIREVALLWRDAAGQSHALHLVARDGKQQERGAGFVARATLDGRAFSVPGQGRSAASAHAGDLEVRFIGTTRQNGIDVDTWRVRVGELLDLSLSARVAHPSMQAPGEAEVHFNLLLNSLQTTPRVHGVLGQTYRTSQEQEAKAVKYTQLVQLLGRPVQADADSGNGFLEGRVADYETSSILKPDCKFAAFTA